jgi:hypothetical protein
MMAMIVFEERITIMITIQHPEEPSVATLAVT